VPLNEPGLSRFLRQSDVQVGRETRALVVPRAGSDELFIQGKLEESRKAKWQREPVARNRTRTRREEGCRSCFSITIDAGRYLGGTLASWPFGCQGKSVS